MDEIPPPSGPESPQFELAPFAGFLSYLVPGLGQIYQGRIGKGLLFFVCLYGLFFYGMYLGNWKNVYIQLEDPARPRNDPGMRSRFSDLIVRVQYYGQFFIGVAAWPAIYQHLYYNPKEPSFLGEYQRLPTEEELNRLQRDGDKTWDLGWVYTVIAGVLNILVIYDAFAGPALASATKETLPKEQTVAA